MRLISILLVFTVINNVRPELGDQDYCEGDSCTQAQKPSSSCRPFQMANFSPDSKSIFFGSAQGRLGNQLLGYALLSHFRRALGVEAYINSECKQYLSKVFTEDSIHCPVLEDTFCNSDDIPFEGFHGHIKDLLTNKEHRTGKIYNMWPMTEAQPHGYRPEEHLCNEQEAMQKTYINFLKKTLEFKPSIMTKVKKTMKQVAKKMGLKPKEVTYVGMHNRRTDSKEFVSRDWYEAPLREDYFIDAMEYFREEYDNVAFLYVSDDMDWGRNNLPNDEGDLFLVGSGDQSDEGIGFDLAVLVNSNHTVISRGTYSMWGAILCGGEYYTEYGSIVPDMYRDEE